MKRIAALTGGGDVPGLNPAIRAVVRRAEEAGLEVLGIRDGWHGLIADDTIPLSRDAVSGILPKGGTILGTSRTNPLTAADGIARIKATIARRGIDAVVAIGGDDTLGAAAHLARAAVAVVGIPKTMDNDVWGTDATIGFDTAVNTVMEAIDRLHSTTESHHRIMVVEVMGRNAGWVAAVGGLAGGADVILIPEEPFDIDEVCTTLRRRHATGRRFSIVAAAEGATPKGGGSQQTVQGAQVDAFGHPRLGGIGIALADEIGRRLEIETRATALGHIQRGGSPSAFDRVLATRFGIAAVEALAAGRTGVMVALRGPAIVTVPLDEVIKGTRTLDPTIAALTRLFW
ncbi:MAG TPA: ATP-dependent 6-phosphofructokinase [bacterium]|nr:ATP-dependent 6-phosphofructokinase [bacterium]